MTQVLASWKEIANFMGKGVRTVQRWERSLGLPVHRPAGEIRNVVFALPHELEAWVTNDRRGAYESQRAALLFGTDAELQDGVRSGLEEAGYIVFRCANSNQAVYVHQLHPKLNLVVVGSEVDESCMNLLQTMVAENSNIQALVLEGSNVFGRLGARFTKLRRPISSEAILRASIIEEIKTSETDDHEAFRTPAA